MYDGISVKRQKTMSQVNLDVVLNKYTKKQQKSQNELIYTQRKRQSNDHIVTFMDNNYTPSKLLNTQKSIHNSKYIQQNDILLRQLDETQKKLVISQKNYTDIYRRYEKLKQIYEMLQLQLQQQKKCKLQHFIDLQNKLHLLQIQNQKNLAKIKQKEQIVLSFKQKLKQKQQSINIFQKELEQISKKLSQTMYIREKQSQKYTQKDIPITKQQNTRSFDSIKQKYQKQISMLNTSISKFNIDLLQKQKQKRKLLQQMESLSKQHVHEIKQLKDNLLRNQLQYKNWLEQAKQDKLTAAQKYQQQLRELKKSQFLTKLNKENNEIEQLTKSKQILRQLQQKNIQLLNEIKKIKLQKQNLSKNLFQSHLKINNINQQLKYLKSQYHHVLSENKCLLQKLSNQQEKFNYVKTINNKKQIQMQQIKINNQNLLIQNQKLSKQLQNSKLQINKQTKSLINAKKQLNQLNDNQLNMNSILTQTTIKMKQKIQTLQQQLQTLTTQLYAQRLEKAKLAQQLQQTKTQLRKQYQLSLQNTKQQLQQQIKQNLKGRNNIDGDKQKIYLEMFKLQRQYELLKSQVVTAEEVIKMGNKMHKFYQKKNK